jgi:hypothetical protein
LYGLGMPKVCGYFAISNTIINLGLVYPFSLWLGINGIALSFLIGHIIIAPSFVLYVNNKVLNLSVLILLKEVFLRPAAAGILTVFVLKVVMRGEIGNIAALLGVMMSTSVLYLVVANFFGVFSKEEKEHIVGYMRVGRKVAATDAV